MPIEVVNIKPSRVFLAMPCTDGIAPETMMAAEMCLEPNSLTQVERRSVMTSLLANQFNELWVQCLNEREEKGFTEFAMIHADVSSEPGWLDKMIRERKRIGVDLLSAAVAVKNMSGDVSMAVQDLKTEAIQRLNLKELRKLPPTFTIEDLRPGNSKNYGLCLNTGLWVIDIDKVGKLQDADKSKPFVWFEVRDTIHHDGKKYVARNLPEDWFFSIQCRQRGLKLAATRAIKVRHRGFWWFDNQ